jgi:hypothetical protein
MSLEQRIADLNDHVIALYNAIHALTTVIIKIEAKETAEPVKPEPVKEKPVKAVKAEPVVEAPAPVVEAAPVMPAAPTFEPVVEAPAGAKAPFTDGKGLIDYVMTAYKEMGAEKGAKIQGVLSEMGLQNVNELRPTEYDAFYAKVEALK